MPGSAFTVVPGWHLQHRAGIGQVGQEHTHTLALLPKEKKAGILLWEFGGEVRGEGQGGDGRCSRSNDADGNC